MIRRDIVVLLKSTLVVQKLDIMNSESQSQNPKEIYGVQDYCMKPESLNKLFQMH